MTQAIPETAPANRRDALRDEAARIFAENGYHGASMQEIADKLGFTKANIYYYYRSKEELLFDILTYADAQMTRLLREAEEQEPDPVERIGRLVSSHVTWYLSHADIARVAFRDWSALTGEALEIQKGRRRRHGRMLHDAVEECRVTGILPSDANVGLITNFINGAVGASNAWFRPDGGVSPEQVGEQFRRYAIAVVRGNEVGTK